MRAAASDGASRLAVAGSASPGGRRVMGRGLGWFATTPMVQASVASCKGHPAARDAVDACNGASVKHRPLARPRTCIVAYICFWTLFLPKGNDLRRALDERAACFPAARLASIARQSHRSAILLRPRRLATSQRAAPCPLRQRSRRVRSASPEPCRPQDLVCESWAPWPRTGFAHNETPRPPRRSSSGGCPYARRSPRHALQRTHSTRSPRRP